MPTLPQSYLTNEVTHHLTAEAPEHKSVTTFPTEAAHPAYNRFLASPLPLIATYQPDALRQFYRGGVPQQRIFPAGG